MSGKNLKPGHVEIIGETYAKMEFYEQGWNPYDRFLDTDKVDLILRRRIEKNIEYREIQVKFGKLHKADTKFERDFFDFTTWRFFNPNEFDEFIDHQNLYIVYIVSQPRSYKGDIFIFPVKAFSHLLKNAIPSRDKVKLYISHSTFEDKWYVRKKSKFNEIDKDSVIEVTSFRRNFSLLD